MDCIVAQRLIPPPDVRGSIQRKYNETENCQLLNKTFCKSHSNDIHSK